MRKGQQCPSPFSPSFPSTHTHTSRAPRCCRKLPAQVEQLPRDALLRALLPLLLQPYLLVEDGVAELAVLSLSVDAEGGSNTAALFER